MKTYVVLDLETTGLDYQSEQIIEIGAIKIDANFNEIDRFHTMVGLAPGKELPEFITKLTGITAEDLKGKRSEDDALATLKSFIGNSVVVAQNAPFDLSFIVRGGIEPKEFICTRALVRYVEPELSASLKDVTRRNGIVLTGHHRALNDVEATIEVLKRYIGRFEEGVNIMNLVMDEPSRPLRFIPKGANVRTVQHLALDSVDLLEIFENLPNGSQIYTKIANIIIRTMKGRV
jgi:DNA polymerase III subunit epsilon